MSSERVAEARAGAESAASIQLSEVEGESIRWFGDTITVKNAGPTFDVAVITAVTGSEPPLHVHEGADEALVVVESGSARLVMIVAPSGVLAMFSEVEELVGPREMPARPRPTDIAAVAQQLEKHCVRLARPNPRHLEPNGHRPHA